MSRLFDVELSGDGVHAGKRCAARARALAASSSRFLGAAVVSPEHRANLSEIPIAVIAAMPIRGRNLRLA